ncbi:MAG: signal recognition particle-docking protein FtsY [Phycisphaeraceae bacterium]|nr:signal recognition particle-docking protein FtsY [Phycisphaerae bacterium]MBX3391759.1 signal recognition particle-docking protein FtsY [Phycisphaeraceae bacterium]
MGFFKTIISKLRQGLERTRESFVTGIRSILLGRRLDEDLIAEVERRLLESDVGVRTANRLVGGIREAFRSGRMERGDQALDYIKAQLKTMWPPADRELLTAGPGNKPTVILVTGVNGVGKTTSIAKLCRTLRDRRATVLLGACDTFRAGAVRQLEIWSERLGVEVVKGQQGGDPAAVAFDACAAAKARGVDFLILDTAGRLHTQDPLMRQLTKIRSVVSKQIPGAPHEVLLVLDATSGQNALRQAEEFDRAVGEAVAAGPGDQAGGGGGRGGVTGIFLAKLDGTARGGIVIAIKDVTSIPVKFIGVGETPEDIQPFDPDAFVEAMFAPDQSAGHGLSGEE